MIFNTISKNKKVMIGVTTAKNIDNFQEFSRFKKLREASGHDMDIGFRINPQVGWGSIGAMSTATPSSKFGIPLVFYGESGEMKISRNGFTAFPRSLITDPPDPATADLWKGKGIVAKPHLQNWIDCIKSRVTPNAPVEVGHRSVTICHLANIARQLRRRIRWATGERN